MPLRKLVIRLLPLLLAIALLAAGCSAGDTAQAFTAQTLDGGSFTEKDIAAKDLTAINFWGTFCSPCIAEMPDLAAFEKALPDNVQLITVCTDAQGNEGKAKALLELAGYEGITLVSGDEAFQSLLTDIQAIPTTIFLDSSGKQVGKAVIGGQADLSGVFLDAMNKALQEGGKKEITLET